MYRSIRLGLPRSRRSRNAVRWLLVSSCSTDFRDLQLATSAFEFALTVSERIGRLFGVLLGSTVITMSEGRAR